MLFWRPALLVVASSSHRSPLGRTGSDSGRDSEVGEELNKQLLWGCWLVAVCTSRLAHGNLRRAEKPPAGKAADLVLG